MMDYCKELIEKKASQIASFMVENDVYFNYLSNGKSSKFDFIDAKTSRTVFSIDYNGERAKYSEVDIPNFSKVFKWPMSVLFRWNSDNIYELTDIIKANIEVIERYS